MEITIKVNRAEEQAVTLPKFFTITPSTPNCSPRHYALNESEGVFIRVWRNTLIEVGEVDYLASSLHQDDVCAEITQDDFMDAYYSALRLFNATLEIK